MSIYKIAAKTGFSVSTVARALSGTGYCSKEKKKIILQVAKEMNYKPNHAAKELRQKETKRIIFGIPEIDNPYYFKMIQGVNSLLEEHGYIMMIFNTKKQLKKELEMIDLLAQKYCDGIILVSHDFSETNVNAIRETNRPAVILNRYLDQRPDDNFDYVYNNHIQAMEFATEHLVQRGCKKILLFTGDQSEQTSSERTQGYYNVLRKYNIPIDKKIILNGDYRKDCAYEVFKKFLRNNPVDFDGIVTSNDMMALGVLDVCDEVGIKVPDNFKLVSFDNTDMANIIKPKLSSIDLHEYELGRKGSELLLERLNGRVTATNYTLTPTLYVRQSSEI